MRLVIRRTGRAAIGGDIVRCTSTAGCGMASLQYGTTHVDLPGLVFGASFEDDWTHYGIAHGLPVELLDAFSLVAYPAPGPGPLDGQKGSDNHWTRKSG